MSVEVRNLAFCLVISSIGCNAPPAESAGDPVRAPIEEDGSPVCAGAPGTFSAQRLRVDGEERRYFIHVPAAYRCEDAWPLLLDFHGTSTGPAPEEAYQLDAVIASADAHGFIVVRPRSRSSREGDETLYRWDQNPGDIERNVAFSDALVAEISRRYHVDPARMYVAGFSSGTNMAMQLLADTRFPFSGFAAVGGGLWDDPGLPDLSRRAPRVYTVTGYRDYMHEFLRDLEADLDAAGLPRSARLDREDAAGHDLYAWHYEEMWRWLDEGLAPPHGKLAAPWRAESVGADSSLLSLAKSPSGDVLAAGSGGEILRRDRETATWSRVAKVGGDTPPNLTGLCILPSGAGIAVGERFVARTTDGGASFVQRPGVPEFQGSSFGTSYLNGVACGGDGRIWGGGYWTGVVSPDGGETWQGAAMTDTWGYRAQVAAMAVSEGGTVVATGYFGYIGRGRQGKELVAIRHDATSEWLTGVAAAPDGHFWVVGEAGEILHSSDDGQTFQRQHAPRSEDLYAVGFADRSTGLAVGLHGVALLTRDGGKTWNDVSTGIDRYLSAVTFLDAKTALVAGERGTVLRLSL